MARKKVKIPEKVKKRLISEVPRFKKIVKYARKAKFNEAATEKIVSDILTEVFGFHEYKEVYYQEKAYAKGRKKVVDIIIRLQGEIIYCIEAKAAYLALKEKHVKQAARWANAAGVPSFVLTNGLEWQIRSINKKESTKSILVSEFDLTKINPKKEDDQQKLFMLCREGVGKDLIKKAAKFKSVMNAYVIGAVLQHDNLLKQVRKNMKKVSPGFNVSIDAIRKMVTEEVLRPDMVNGDDIDIKNTKKKVRKALSK